MDPLSSGSPLQALRGFDVALASWLWKALIDCRVCCGNDIPHKQCTSTQPPRQRGWVTFFLSSFSSAVFICSFMVAAPIFGYLGDRFNRKVILSCGIFFWSVVTLSSSFIGKEVGNPHESACTHSRHGRANDSVLLRICLRSGRAK